MRPRVRIDETMCVQAVPAEREKLRPLLPIAQRTARRWDVDIVLTAPHGAAQMPLQAERTVFVHVFAKPAGSIEAASRPVTKTKISSAFRYPVPASGILPFPSPGVLPAFQGDATALRVNMAQNDADFVIAAPEGASIFLAAVFPGNVYILFDLAHEDWPGRDAVFTAILEEAMPRALVAPTLLRNREAAERYAQWRFSGDRRGLERAVPPVFAECSLRSIHQHLRGLSDAQDRAEKEARGALGEYTETVQSAVALREMLASFDRDPDVEMSAIAREFDAILAMRNVRGCQVVPSSIQSHIEIATDRIFHQGDGDANEDIGEFLINIRPLAISVGKGTVGVGVSPGAYIHFRQPRYRGTHQHKYAQESSTCFGSVGDTGLNAALTKLLGENDFVSIVHLALTFLEQEVSPASPRTVSVVKPYEPPPPYYGNDEEREEARRAYAKFVHALRERHRRNVVEAKLREDEQRAETLQGKAAKAHHERRALQDHVIAAERIIEEAHKRIEAQWNILRTYPYFRCLERRGDAMVATFLPNGVADIPALPLTVWFLDKDGTVWVRSSWKTASGLRCVNTDGTIVFSQSVARAFADLIASARLGEALTNVVDVALRLKAPEEAFPLVSVEENREEGAS